MKDHTLRSSPPKGRFSHFPDLERTLFHARGIENDEEAERFLEPDYVRDTHDPFELRDMDKAVSRFLKAVKNEEHIAIFGDFDADGVCSTALLSDFLSRIGYRNVSFYIPHRHEEGFGVSVSALSDLAEKGVTLVITVDCGIADVGAISQASSLGLDVIVTDHHEPVNGLPKARAVIDPKRSDCAYPNPDLCGAGIAFKFVQAVLARDRCGISEGQEKWLLDLVGIATISDMVPLRGENRVFASYGLLVLRRSPRVGILKLCRTLPLSQRHLSEDDVGFMITPRLNAASRMGDAEDAFVLLSTSEEAKAEEVLKILEKINTERKGVVASMVKEIKRTVRVSHDENVIVAGNPKWRPSLLGLAANTLAEEFSRPVFLWGRDGSQEIKGSCRSDGNVDTLALMSSAAHVFEQFGGHQYAGGFSVSFEEVHTLREQLNEAYEKNECSIPEQVNEIDADLSLDDVTPRLYERLERFAPFGMANPKPVFRFSNITPERVRALGKEKNHLELTFKNSAGRDIKVMGFFMTTGSFKREVREGEVLTLIANLERSFFRGRLELRLRIVDIV